MTKMTSTPKVKKTVTFTDKTRALYNAMKSRGPVSFTLADFRSWLAARATPGPFTDRLTGLWKCEYSREFIAIEQVSVDHKLPLSMGGTGTLDNLAVCTERMNRIKGAIPFDQFLDLKDTVDRDWPREAATEFWKRLAMRPTWRRKKRIGRFGVGI